MRNVTLPQPKLQFRNTTYNTHYTCISLSGLYTFSLLANIPVSCLYRAIFIIIFYWTIHIISSSGTFVSLKTPILTELLGIENLTASYGFLHMFIGIASFIGSPLAGKCWSVYLSYDVVVIQWKTSCHKML